jgi:hypothetical protein
LVAFERAQRWLITDELGRSDVEAVPAGMPAMIAYTITMVDGSSEDQVHVLLPSGRIGRRHWGSLTSVSVKVL